MKTDSSRGAFSNWTIVILFAIAMAWVESAVVYYLRTHIDRIVPYQSDPLPIIGGLGPVELVRELATLIMLFTVGWLAGKTWRTRCAFPAGAWMHCASCSPCRSTGRCSASR